MFKGKLNIKYERNNEEIELLGGFLNDDSLIEFESMTGIEDSRIIYNKGNLIIQGKSRKILKLSQSVSSQIDDFLFEVTEEIKNLYKDIARGKERILLLPLDIEDYQYLATTLTALDHGLRSQKYSKALSYCFTDNFLKMNNLKPLGVSTNSEMQVIINNSLKGVNLDKDKNGIAYIKYNELLNYIYNSIKSNVA